MAELHANEILAQLQTGQFQLFIGMRENDYFEAKGATPYDLTSPLGRYELAKDVSAFANAEGGIVVIGLTHKKLDTENTDEVTGVTPLIESDIPIAQMSGIIKTHIWPQISGLDIKWLASKDDSTRGLGYIYIPQQHEDRKFFLITKVVEQGEPLKEIVFGIARRVKADNIPLTPAELHRCIGEGRHSQAQRLTRIENKLDSLVSQRAGRPGEAATHAIERRIKSLLGEP
jgi:predicted HTH transcriptional regulator